MKITYDPQQDTVRILFSNAPIDRSVAEGAGMILDYDSRGSIVGLEMTEASRRIFNPQQVEFSNGAHTPGAEALPPLEDGDSL